MSVVGSEMAAIEKMSKTVTDHEPDYVRDRVEGAQEIGTISVAVVLIANSRQEWRLP